MKRFLVIAFVLAGLTPGAAFATLIGDQIDIDRVGPSAFSFSIDDVTVVDPQIEVPNDGFLQYDVSASSIKLLRTGGAFAGGSWFVTFSDLDWVGKPNGIITGLTVTEVFNPTNGGFLTDSSVTFTDHSVKFQAIGSNSWVAGDHVIIDLETSDNIIPEPSTFVLLLMGMLGTGLYTYRRKQMT
jgi:hypothetical protein